MKSKLKVFRCDDCNLKLSVKSDFKPFKVQVAVIQHSRNQGYVVWDCCEVCFDARHFKRPYFDIDNSKVPPVDGPFFHLIDWCKTCIGRQKVPCVKCMKKTTRWRRVVEANPSLSSKSSTSRWLQAYESIFGESNPRDIVTSDVEIVELSEECSEENVDIRRAERLFGNIREDDDGNPIQSYYDQRRDMNDERRREDALSAEQERKKKRRR